ncbi:MAG: hypothetical protein ACOYMA_09080 [Bacteroidia bacterium]
MKTKTYFFIMYFTFIAVKAFSQDTSTSIFDGLFEQAYYGKPFVAEMHSTISKIETGYSKSYSEYNLLAQTARFERPVVEVHLGIDAPLFAYNFGKIGKGYKWGIAASLPLSIHVLEDMWDPVTAAVINTDYRFGSPRIRAIRYFTGYKYLKNISISWLPIFHECTHLGDEITSYRKDEKFPITRLNVSYEYTELQLTINDPSNTRENIHSYRIGGSYRISDRGYGWFSVRPESELTAPVNLQQSNKNSEFYLQYQFQRASGFMASKRVMNLLSFEARYRVQYGVPEFKKVNDVWETKEMTEKMTWNFNFYYGWKFNPKSENNHSMSLLFHAYKGINPFGQLRNYPGYPFFAIALTYEP